MPNRGPHVRYGNFTRRCGTGVALTESRERSALNLVNPPPWQLEV
jgi:hypothetical protein